MCPLRLAISLKALGRDLGVSECFLHDGAFHFQDEYGWIRVPPEFFRREQAYVDPVLAIEGIA